MLIPILKGTTEIIEKVKDGETIKNGCPQCRHDLVLKQFRVWGTFFLIPVAPTAETRFVYECTGCSEMFDPVYRTTFINKAKYLNATPKEIRDLTDTFSLTILAAVLTCDNRPLVNVIDTLKDFAISYKIDLETHEEKFSAEFLTKENLAETVLQLYDTFGDSFDEDYRKKALHRVLKYCNLIDLTGKEAKLLYTYSRHWGLSKAQFEDLYKSQINK
jgi:hypothetical protein